MELRVCLGISKAAVVAFGLDLRLRRLGNLSFEPKIMKLIEKKN
jgi:hypothetical protein